MKHFILFIALIFLTLFLAILNKEDRNLSQSSMPTLRIFGYSSFTGNWGPGPLLKKEFEKVCQCKVEFLEASDSGVILQRLRMEGESLRIDLVLGLDQFDLAKAEEDHKWRKLSLGELNVHEPVKPALKINSFVPYDWGPLAFVTRKTALGGDTPKKLDDLLAPSWKNKIALEDPRTSSPGMQFLYWVLKSKGEEAGFKFIAEMMKQAHSHSPSWSTAYGLFKSNQAQMVYSYLTSPLYHQIEEEDSSYVALSFEEPLPVQFEFVGIPEYCRNCELAERFINFMLSSEGQKIIMQKNYMLPVMKGVIDGTPFEKLAEGSYQKDFFIPSTLEVEAILKKWTELRRSEIN